jgi:hypothetical protein
MVAASFSTAEALAASTNCCSVPLEAIDLGSPSYRASSIQGIFGALMRSRSMQCGLTNAVYAARRYEYLLA